MRDLSAVPWQVFPPDAGPADKVSPHFTLYELTRSETAARLRIDNSFPGPAELRSAVFLCREVLEPLRSAFGPFSPNSVFRCQGLERAMKKKRAGWKSTSQHVLGQACDVEIPGKPTLELAEWVASHLEFDQLICECYDPAQGANSGWVHVSRVAPGLGVNRGAKLSYILDRATGRYAYVEGLQPGVA